LKRKYYFPFCERIQRTLFAKFTFTNTFVSIMVLRRYSFLRSRSWKRTVPRPVVWNTYKLIDWSRQYKLKYNNFWRFPCCNFWFSQTMVFCRYIHFRFLLALIVFFEQILFPIKCRKHNKANTNFFDPNSLKYKSFKCWQFCGSL
jgi:hypothetical protein